jgi:Ca-activated chloride channel family protein
VDQGRAVSELLFTRGALWPWLLCLPALGFALFWALRRSHRAALRYGAVSRERVPGPLWRTLRLSLLLALAFLTWMDPRYGEEDVAVERRGLDVVFCLDTSRSMLARDAEPDRLQRAIQDVKSVLPKLQGGDRAGLVVFAGQARLWIPLTHDLDSFRELIDEVDTNVVPVGGSDLAGALRKAREILEPGQQATSVVVMLTDGEDLGGKAREAAAELAGDHIVVHTVGYGSRLGSKIVLQKGGQESFLKNDKGEEVVSAMDPETLRAVATASGGEFVRADAMPLPLVELHDKRLLPMLKRSFETGSERAHRARYQWVLLPALLLLLWELLSMGGRRR